MGSNLNRWTPEEDFWLTKNIAGRSFQEISDVMNSLFHKGRTPASIQNRCAHVLHIGNGRNTRLNGQKHWTAGLSSEEIKAHYDSGYFEHTVSERMREANKKHRVGSLVGKKGQRGEPLIKNGPGNADYTTLGRYTWEKEYGPIPKNCRLIYLDRDYRNCGLDNLRLVPKKYFSHMQRWNNWYEGSPEVTQKPVSLLEYLIKTYSNPGDTVLDNCMGSGSTGVACVNTGRNFIGIEKEEKYFAIASARIYEADEDPEDWMQ